jgi:hypothetical protein
MKHIFISHAGPDAALADRLANDLRNAGHDTKVDTQELRLGDDIIEFINEGIADARVVILLYSKHTPVAKWQKLEISSAVWNQVEQGGGQCVVIKLDDVDIPPVLGPKLYGKLDPTDGSSYQELFERLCETILPKTTASSVISDAFRSESKNPFRLLRAEYFEDRPDLHAKMFAPPGALKIGALEEMKPCFLEGSRGTGKSMLLLSLRARNFFSRHRGSVSRYRIFGFYLKLTRGAICNAGVLSNPTGELTGVSAENSIQLVDIASQEIIVCLIENLLSELDSCVSQNLLTCDHSLEKTLVQSCESILFGQVASHSTSFDELLEKLADLHRSIAEFIRRRFIYGEQPIVPVATFDLDALKRVVRLIKKLVPSLATSMFVALLDEYENLFPYQQRLVNGIVKLAPPDVSVKIAKKLGSYDTSGTTTGQELQETHDYTRLPLIYDVEDSNDLAAYHDLLKHIVNNILRSEGLGAVDVRELLPEDQTPEVDAAKLEAELAKLSRVSLEGFRSWPDNKRRERLTYYGEAAIYRVLYCSRGRHRDKRFSGFNQLAFVSSGVIRYLQEILGVAYHLTYGVSGPSRGTVVLPPSNQSSAVHFVSQHNLTTLSRNVERDGEALKYLLVDLGDCLRHKLLKHTSEPEAARLAIADPERLDQTEMAQLRNLLVVGVREGVFQTKEGLLAFKPKHSSDPQPSEFNICRIFAPALEVSPRLRWRTKVTCDDLLGLASSDRRAQSMQQLKTQMVKGKADDAQKPLFG